MHLFFLVSLFFFSKAVILQCALFLVDYFHTDIHNTTIVHLTVRLAILQLGADRRWFSWRHSPILFCGLPFFSAYWRDPYKGDITKMHYQVSTPSYFSFPLSSTGSDLIAGCWPSGDDEFHYDEGKVLMWSMLVSRILINWDVQQEL